MRPDYPLRPATPPGERLTPLDERGRPPRGPGYQKAPDEATLKRLTLERDNGICYVCGLPGADQADHITPVSEGGPHDLSNRAAIHSYPCHHRKTQREAARARTRNALRNKRAPEKHPGLR